MTDADHDRLRKLRAVEQIEDLAAWVAGQALCAGEWRDAAIASDAKDLAIYCDAMVRKFTEVTVRLAFVRDALQREPLCPVPISEPRDRLSRDDCIMRGECGCTASGEEIRSLRARAEAAEQRAEKLAKAARDVCWFEWSDIDDDADCAMERLRDSLNTTQPQRDAGGADGAVGGEGLYTLALKRALTAAPRGGA